MNNITKYRSNHQQQQQPTYAIFRGITRIALLTLLVSTMTACTLQRDEHTVQFQQLHQPNEQSETLPVWRDVYSESIVHDVYSPQGNTEFLP